MFHFNKSMALSMACVLAAGGDVFADGTSNGTLSLDPRALTADVSASSGLLMSGLDKVGAGKTLEDAKLNIYGWLETGYTYNHRHSNGSSGTVILPGPFNHEFGNHYMINQFDLRFERLVATDKFDVGGLVEVMYGSDAARIHSTGLGYNGSDGTDDNAPADELAVDNLHPILQFDIPQAYVNVNLPMGSGLQLMIGKWVTLLGYETIDPRGNPFYSHSYLFSAVPGTQTGIVGSYQMNDALGLKLGFSRGWDVTLEDNNGSAIDVTGRVSYSFSKQLAGMLNFNVGPENAGDTSHYRTVINPIFSYRVTEKLRLGLEGLYIFDGGYNANVAGFSEGRTHAYGDTWGAALYAGYTINEMFTINGRLETSHGFLGTYSGVSMFDAFGTIPAINSYEITVGTTIMPFPKDAYLKGLVIRPEIRYDFTDSRAFPFYSANENTYKDQLTFSADVIFSF